MFLKSARRRHAWFEIKLVNRVNEKLIKTENLGNNFEYQSLKILEVARLRIPYQILVNKEKKKDK